MRIPSLPERFRPGRSGPIVVAAGATGGVATTAPFPARVLARRGSGFTKFRERNLTVIGAVTAAALLAAVLLSFNFSKIPFLAGTTTERAMFANAGGLANGDIVTVAGVRVGQVTGFALEHAEVQVTFTVADGVHLGSRTSAAMKVLTPVGQEYLELAPAGPGRLTGPIPESRTTIPDTLVGVLSHLSSETSRIHLHQFERSLDATAGTLRGVPTANVASALTGLARFSAVIASRKQDLSTLVTSASKLTAVLADHSAQLVNLVGQGDLVLKVLEQRRAEIRTLLATTSSLGRELTSILTGNRSQLIGLVRNLDAVSKVLAHDANKLGSAMPLIAAFSRYSANATGSGPFADFTLPALLVPDNVIQQCAHMRLSDPLKGCRV